MPFSPCQAVSSLHLAHAIARKSERGRYVYMTNIHKYAPQEYATGSVLVSTYFIVQNGSRSEML